MRSGRGSVLIVPTGGANLASLTDAFARLGVACAVSAEPAAYDRAERIVLPGVGAAPVARQRLAATGLADRLRRERRPVLGICLGMQILFESSAEGEAEGLAVFAGRVERLATAPGVAVPHMGWSRVRRTRESRLLDGVADRGYFYFAHSFAACPQGDTVAEAEHGGRFAAVVERPPFYGTQFHPERSARDGARLLANFLAIAPCG